MASEAMKTNFRDNMHMDTRVIEATELKIMNSDLTSEAVLEAMLWLQWHNRSMSCQSNAAALERLPSCLSRTNSVNLNASVQTGVKAKQ